MVFYPRGFSPVSYSPNFFFFFFLEEESGGRMEGWIVKGTPNSQVPSSSRRSGPPAFRHSSRRRVATRGRRPRAPRLAPISISGVEGPPRHPPRFTALGFTHGVVDTLTRGYELYILRATNKTECPFILVFFIAYTYFISSSH